MLYFPITALAQNNHNVNNDIDFDKAVNGLPTDTITITGEVILQNNYSIIPRTLIIESSGSLTISNESTVTFNALNDIDIINEGSLTVNGTFNLENSIKSKLDNIGTINVNGKIDLQRAPDFILTNDGSISVEEDGEIEFPGVENSTTINNGIINNNGVISTGYIFYNYGDVLGEGKVKPGTILFDYTDISGKIYDEIQIDFEFYETSDDATLFKTVKFYSQHPYVNIKSMGLPPEPPIKEGYDFVQWQYAIDSEFDGTFGNSGLDVSKDTVSEKFYSVWKEQDSTTDLNDMNRSDFISGLEDSNQIIQGETSEIVVQNISDGQDIKISLSDEIAELSQKLPDQQQDIAMQQIKPIAEAIITGTNTDITVSDNDNTIYITGTVPGNAYINIKWSDNSTHMIPLTVLTDSSNKQTAALTELDDTQSLTETQPQQLADIIDEKLSIILIFIFCISAIVIWVVYCKKIR